MSIKPDLIVNPDGSVAWARDRRTRREYEKERQEAASRAAAEAVLSVLIPPICSFCDYYETCPHPQNYHPNWPRDDGYDRDYT